MKKNISILLALSLFPITGAFADSPAGYLTDYQYQVANLPSMADAQRLIDMENTDTRRKSICASRAAFWSYDIYRRTRIQVGKVFIHFTPKGQADENGEWAYHVAPYVLVNGEEVVLDNGFFETKGRPTPIKEWSKYFGKSENCVVLDPVKNPAHLKLEQNNMPNDWTLPKDFTGGNSRQYPTPKDSTCYIRKVPMYYTFPVDVYGADLNFAGQPGHESFKMEKFNTIQVLNACSQAMSMGFKRDHSCEDYFGLKRKP